MEAAALEKLGEKPEEAKEEKKEEKKKKKAAAPAPAGDDDFYTGTGAACVISQQISRTGLINRGFVL